MSRGRGDYIRSFTVLRYIHTASAGTERFSIDIPLYIEHTNAPRKPKGFEDIRLFVWNGVIYGIATTYKADGGNRMYFMPIISEQALTEKTNLSAIRVKKEDATKIISPLSKKGSFDKNWVPFIYEGNLMLSYSSFPHIVLAYDKNARGRESNFPIKYQTGRKIPALAMRGGSQAIPISGGDEYIGCGHVRNGMKYTHYFYSFENKPPFAIKRISSVFVIGEELYQKDRVQFVAGIAEIDGKIILTYGESDAEAYEVEIPTERVLNALIPIS